MKAFFLNDPRTWNCDHPVYRTICANLPEGWSLTKNIDESDLVMVPTAPAFDNSRPWVVFIEDWVTLYHPHIVNGSTAGINLIDHPKTHELRKMFSHPNFRGILCHHRDTFDDLSFLDLTDKLFYFTFGLPAMEYRRVGANQELSFVFINSWKADYTNFLNRGGGLMLKAFREVARDVGVRLRILCPMPASVDRSQFNGLSNVERYEHFISDSELNGLLRQSDCLILPSHRVHVYSILHPFSYSIPVITSDGWGTGEYVVSGWNGWKVKGIYGRTSFHNQIMREDYSRQPETLEAADGLARVMRRVVLDRPLLQRWSRNAWDYVNNVHSLDRMRKMLGSILSSI